MTLQIKVKNNNNNKLSLAEIEVSSCEIWVQASPTEYYHTQLPVLHLWIRGWTNQLMFLPNLKPNHLLIKSHASIRYFFPLEMPKHMWALLGLSSTLCIHFLITLSSASSVQANTFQNGKAPIRYSRIYY
jgi:hypothetical protein